ncbi:hypothetical protein AHF37_03979 [Paragonimus kellicotti]|nr:hypothetical protein AHF37_03979 [Paragonimus kellicotti]
MKPNKCSAFRRIQIHAHINHYLIRIIQKRPVCRPYSPCALSIFGLFVLLYLWFIVGGLFYPYLEPRNVANYSVLTSATFQQRWKALSELNGATFRSHGPTPKTDCTAPSISDKGLFPLPYRAYHVVGTQMFAFPAQMDLLGRICLFRKGQSIRNGSVRDRDFPLVHNQSERCSGSQTPIVDLLLLIRSAHIQWNRRDVIRKLWANKTCWTDLHVQHVFLLGTTPNRHQMDRIAKEARRHKDVVQQDFLDSYRNITYKFLLGLQWAIAFCPQAKWLLFIDDDFFVHPKLLSAFLGSLHPNFRYHLTLGSQHTNSEVIRDISKWGISETLYAPDKYPNFVSGGSHLLGSELALELYIGSRFTNYFPLDDVFTGIILNKLLRTTLHSNKMIITFPRARYKLQAHRIMTSTRSVPTVTTAIIVVAFWYESSMWN